ncbi:tagaturonate reductase [Saccharibacillus sp. JS10]|uniref:tagaturonate reductase n=1 Tax=Saccharibacillus sp. JS10 TaxID=2950552 RepID=UPI00210E1017|nr:tagaturonate reductase [Saccharibacillus sp. JS10]MCQ4085647.1 tagaturonate reductase [Saccharibacillus sp. JS10]
MTPVPQLSAALFPDLTRYPEKVIQFGGGNFMRAFVDWQLQQMNDQGLFQGSAVLVQAFSKKIDPTFAEQDHLFTVLLNGIENGQSVNKVELVSSLSRLLNPALDYEAYLKLAEDEQLSVIVSNTTEAGIVYQPEPMPTTEAPDYFPAKLAALLYRRYTLKKPGFTIIPCELIDRNGEKLLEIVQKHAEDWQLGSEFISWLNTDNTFCCSMVDRIVPGYPNQSETELQQRLNYSDKLAVSAEPYMLWVIEGPQEVSQQLPLIQAGLNVIIVPDMTPYRERKVHLLNGPHTAMVPLGLLSGLDTVEEVVNDHTLSAFLQDMIQHELIPMLDLPADELRDYAKDVWDRFRNPYIRHELRSISLNSISKFKARLLPILLSFAQKRSELPARITFAFAALLHSYQSNPSQRQDEAAVLEIFDRATSDGDSSSFVSSILSETALWGLDLNTVPGLAERLRHHLKELESSSPIHLLNVSN